MSGIPRSEFLEQFFPLKGKPYSLKLYPMFTDIYNCVGTEILLKTGRQVSKSTYNARDILSNMVSIPYYQCLFVCPLKEQTMRFSNNYLGADMESIPFVQEFFMTGNVAKNVFSRGLNNGSLCQLTYVLVDADRARGIPADCVTYDEVQDIPIHNIPIINECLSASPYKFRRYTGTPKTLDNTIEQLWQDSVQMEWVIRCIWCNKDNIPNETHVYKMLGPEGPICAHCAKSLDVRRGRWVAFGPKDAEIFGFHLPQIVMPLHVEPHPKNPDKNPWKEVMRKYRNYGEAEFANEVLGLSFDQGGRLVTLTELVGISVNRPLDSYDNDEMKFRIITAGIDWGISAQTSYTVLTIGSIDPIRHDYKVHYIKRFPSTDILKQIEEICEICKRFQVKYIGADVGVGHTNNLLLVEEFGKHMIFPYQYTAANFVLQFRPNRGFYSLDKTSSLNILFFAMKKKRVSFPIKDYMEPFYSDVLSIFEEMVDTPSGIRKIFNHNKNIPDDFTHALNFALVTAYKAINHHTIMMATGNELELPD